MVWLYEESEYLRTRSVEIIQADDELFYWIRHRTGPEAKAVAVSGGFKKVEWCYVSAVKENWPLPVPAPAAGPDTLAASDDDGPVPDFPPFPPLEPLTPAEQKKADKKKEAQ